MLILDLWSILLGTTAIRLAVAAGLALYARYQETCPGFNRWVLGTTVSAMARASRLLMPVLPMASLLLTSQLQTLASLLILDGVCRHVLRRPLDWRWYGLPVFGLLLTWLLGLKLQQPHALALWAALVIGGITFAGGLLWLRPSPPEGRVLRWTAAGIHFGFVALVAVRVLMAAAFSGIPGLLERSEAAFYLVGGILDMFCLALFVMLDGRYLEDQLLASGARMEGTFRDLEESLARVRLLSGILPICAGCRKIRDDHDAWTPVEEYVAHRTQARISHDPCARCLASGEPA